MGKAARKKADKKNKFYQNKQKAVPITPEAKELLYGLDSADARTRINTSGAISAMFGDVESDLSLSDDMSGQYKSNLEMIMQSNVLRKIIGRITDKEYLVCMNILGALRNMILVGGDSFVATLCDLNIIETVKSVIKSYIQPLQEGNQTDQIIACNVYYQLFSLLTNIFDYDATGFIQMEMDESYNFYSILLTILKFVPPTNSKLALYASEMKLSVAEFISVVEEIQNNGEFLNELLNIAQNEDWPLRFKLFVCSLTKLTLQNKISVLENAVEILKGTSFSSQFNQINELYKQYEQFNQPKENEKENNKEMIVDDKDATKKMNTEALDANDDKSDRDIVKQIQLVSQQILNYMNIFDLITRILTEMTEKNAMSNVPSSLLESIYSLCSTLYSELITISSKEKQAQKLQSTLITGILDLLSSLLPYIQSENILLSLWSTLTKNLTISTEVAASSISLLWKWAQIVTNATSFSDKENPVCYPEQIAPLFSLLRCENGEMVIELINLLSCLLSKTQPIASNQACLTEVCSQVVHCLDANYNATNAEVLGCILDFMMTIFGNDSYVPLFKSLNCNSYVMNATSALQTALTKDGNNLDEDAKDYLDEILSNAVRFIDWIQGGMQ